MRKRKTVDIAILHLPHASNLTDFSSLLKEKDLNLRYVKMAEEIGKPDLLIIPGTRETIQDLLYLKKKGYVNKIRLLAKAKVMIMGISGGFQMLGIKIIDIKGSEFKISQCEGLGFFNTVTRLMPSMVNSEIEFEYKGLNRLSGYEIHTGRTKYLKNSRALFRITKRDGRKVDIPDGAVNEEGNILGTYIHGIFHNNSFRNNFLTMLRQ